MTEVCLFYLSAAADMSQAEKQQCSSVYTANFFGANGVVGEASNCDHLFASYQSLSVYGVSNHYTFTTGSRPAETYSEWAQQDGTPDICEKTVAPLSELFDETTYMKELAEEDEVDVAGLREFVQRSLDNYCTLFDDHRCNFVTDFAYAPNCEGYADLDGSSSLYTGDIDAQFRPHGAGKLEGHEYIQWFEGCPADPTVPDQGEDLIYYTTVHTQPTLGSPRGHTV